MTRGDDGCFTCDKHGEGDAALGGILYEDELVYVGHVHMMMGKPTAYRGWLVLETKRHVAALGDLTTDEAEAIGRLMNRIALLLRKVEGAERVYAFVFGDRVPHLHIHLAPRYQGTPPAFWGPRLNEWPDAPRVDEPAMRDLVKRLRSSLLADGGARTGDQLQ